ncbi:hypothetical protein AEB_P0082 [Altererythrobacter sp. B11]|uniref:hypothetical protein n=1 Tax=Altererythrobacter sp. B11 TaxID=2060312 RepID=UPI000DC72431|nr:hypothetical protein [Altererythrobacter sp. B11]BBC70950.1 hypothetical protein AEB_P0082 [Altererythrobacter sp. B11]
MNKSRLSGGTLSRSAIVLAVCLASAAGNAQVRRSPNLFENCPQLTRLSASEQEAQVQALAASIRAELNQLPATASAQDVEAAIAFAFSQANAPAEIAQRALTALESNPNLSNNVRRALVNARLALADCQGGIGTAAIGQAGAGAGGFFSSSPIIGVGGGGSSNYTSQ